MKDNEFYAVMDLMENSPRWPGDEQTNSAIEDLLQKEAELRGFPNWYDAYNKLKKGERENKSLL